MNLYGSFPISKIGVIAVENFSFWLSEMQFVLNALLRIAAMEDMFRKVLNIKLDMTHLLNSSLTASCFILIMDIMFYA